MANQNTKIYIEHSNLPEKFFSSFEDPRRTNKGHFYYPLNKILFLVISAVVSLVILTGLLSRQTAMGVGCCFQRGQLVEKERQLCCKHEYDHKNSIGINREGAIVKSIKKGKKRKSSAGMIVTEKEA